MNLTLFPHLVGAELAEQFSSLEEQARKLECFETDPWAAEAILRHELLTRFVVDPCCGTGILSEAAASEGYDVCSTDIVNWGYSTQLVCQDWLALDRYEDLMKLPTCPAVHSAPWAYEFTVFMNPPFSKAVEFVDQAQRLGARKIVCFQRFSWRESDGRFDWWAANPPSRVYVCADRATCWRFDIPPERRSSKTSGGGSTPTTHAWFIWERGHPPAAALHAIRKAR